MAVIRCKMCGGDLILTEGSSVAQCDSCGRMQTVPKADDEKKLASFARANRLRASCEFDKAAGVYETIVADFPEEAEAYWGLVLCKYGIEYVDDPATGKKIPTCHRSSYDSVLDDNNFEQALENSDIVAQKVYREEAKQFERIRKGILEVSSNEQPYDIFICYKETDLNGDRTLDSVLAQDLYSALTEKGYRVFFSRITLQGKLGEAYEPYIFAALNSAKVMLAVGTCYEHYNAVWVKNEWSRYLKICETDKSKHLIPCYKGIDAYDMPEEFARLQAQDLGKMGATQDILRGVEKLLPNGKAEKTEVIREVTVQRTVSADTAPMLKRAFMFLEDGDWKSADEYCEKVLDIDPENAKAYLGKLMAELKVRKQEQLAKQRGSFVNNKKYQKLMRFADEALRKTMGGYISAIKKREEEARIAQKKREEEERIAREKREKQLEEARERLKTIREKQIFLQECFAAGDAHTVGLKLDGTVVAVGDNEDSECNVSLWHDIVAIAAGGAHTIGLKSDGTVVAVGWNDDGQCNVSHWKDIVAIAAHGTNSAGLRADGTAVAGGSNYHGRCDVSSWHDIAAITVGFAHTVGLKADGTVVAVGFNNEGNAMCLAGQTLWPLRQETFTLSVLRPMAGWSLWVITRVVNAMYPIGRTLWQLLQLRNISSV